MKLKMILSQSEAKRLYDVGFTVYINGRAVAQREEFSVLEEYYVKPIDMQQAQWMEKLLRMVHPVKCGNPCSKECQHKVYHEANALCCETPCEGTCNLLEGRP